MTMTNSTHCIAQKHNIFRQANDPDTPADVLIALSKSKDEIIRGAIAFNKNTPELVLNSLIHERNLDIFNCLRKRGIITPILIKPKMIIGNNLILRDATIEDAVFILELRTDLKKSRYLSKTSPDLLLQKEWLARYAQDDSQVYFIIQNKNFESIGTVRLYGPRQDSFCWGSWIIKEGSPSYVAIESALIVYHYALYLNFRNAYFSVKKGNKSVWKFHERFGAIKTGESADDYYYNISYRAIVDSLEKYAKFLPNGIEVY